MNFTVPKVSLNNFFVCLFVLMSLGAYCADSFYAMGSLECRALATFNRSPTKLEDAPISAHKQSCAAPSSSQVNSTPNPRRKLVQKFDQICVLKASDASSWRTAVQNYENHELVKWAYQNRGCKADDGSSLAHVVRDFLDQEPEAKARVLSAQLIDRALLDGIGDTDKGVVGLLECGFFSQKRLNAMVGHRPYDHDFGVFPYYVLYNVLSASIANRTSMESGDAQELLKRTLMKKQEIPESFRGELVQNEVKALVQAIKRQLNDDEAWNELCRHDQNGCSSKKSSAEGRDDTAQKNPKALNQGFKLWQLLSIAEGFSFMTEEAQAAGAVWLGYTP